MTGAVDTAGTAGASLAGRMKSVTDRFGSVGAGTFRRLAAVASAFAGLIHYAVVPEHRAEWWLTAVLFTIAGAAQLGWAVLAWWTAERRLLALGLAANVLPLAAWLVSRTSGLPFGPHAGVPEPAGAVDLAAVVAEAVVVALVAGSLVAGRRGAREG